MNIFELSASLTLDTSGFVKAIKSVQNKKSDISDFFQKIGNATDAAKNGISVFGDVLKANLLSDAITKGFETIVSGFETISAKADGFVKSSVSAGMNFDTAMSQVYATMGDKASDMVKYNGEMMESSEALRKFAKEMGATTKYSATESAEALNYMALAGYDAETSMAMLPNVMNLASAGAFDLARASDMLTDTQTAFGISLERTNQMVDEMAAAASNSNTSVAQLGDAFLTVGGLAKELNGGFVTLSNGTTATVDGVQELEIALGAMANAGIKGSEAGTHMRNLLMKLSAPTEDATELFDKLGVSVFDDAGNMKSLKDVFGELNRAFKDMNNQQQKLEAISEIFNARDTASATALLAAVEQSWDSLGESILNAEGAAGKMAETQLDNLNGAITIFKSAKEGLQISISDALNPFMTPFVNFATDSLQALTDTIEKEGVNGLRGTISNVVKNAGTLLYKNVPAFLKNLIKIFTVIKNGIADGLPSFMDFSRAMIMTIAQDMSKELPAFIKAGQRITSAIGKGIIRNFPYLIRAISKIANSITKSISQNLPVILPAVTSGILTMIDEITKHERITDFIDSGVMLLTALAEGLSSSASVLIQKVPDIIKNLKQGFDDNKETIKGAGKTILSVITDEFGEISFSDAVNSIISGLANALDSEEWQTVKEKISQGIQNIDFAEITANISKLIIGVTDSAGKLIDGIDWSVIGNAIGEALNGVDWYGILESLCHLIETTIKNSGELLKGIANTIDSGIALQLATIGVNLLIGKKIAGGIASYLSSTAAFTTVKNALGALFTKLTPAVGAFVVGWDIGTIFRESIISDETVSKIDEFVFDIIDTFKEMGYRIQATAKAIESAFDFESPYRGMTQDQIYKNIVLEETAGGTGYQNTSRKQEILSWGEDLASNFGKGVSNSKDIENAIQDKLNWIHDNMGFSEPKEGVLSDFHTYAPDMIHLFAKGIKDNDYLISDNIKNLNERIKANIKNMIDSAVSWGSDMIANFISGIHQKWDDAVNAVSGFAQMIADFIGFSEPDKGALSRFHTFAPDMIQLFAKGIKENQNLVTGQAETLAGSLADTFQNPLTIGTEFTGFEIPEIPDMSYHIEIISDLIDNVSAKLKEITDIRPIIDTAFSEIQTPELPALTSEIGFLTDAMPKFSAPDLLSRISFLSDKIPDFQNRDIEIRFIDNLDSIIEKTKALTDKAVNFEYSLPELPDLSLTVDTSIIDKIGDMLANPLEISVRFADSLENINETLETPSIEPVKPYRDDYIQQIDEIRNSYATTNHYYQSTENSYQNTRNNTENRNQNQKIVIQNLNLSIPGFNMYSESDRREFVDLAIREIRDKLEVINIRDNRGAGGAGW